MYCLVEDLLNNVYLYVFLVLRCLQLSDIKKLHLMKFRSDKHTQFNTTKFGADAVFQGSICLDKEEIFVM